MVSRESASEVLAEYLESIGGYERLLDPVPGSIKGKKRGRASTGNPPVNGKRRKNGDHPADMEAPESARAAQWKPPQGSWEEHIATLDACMDEEADKIMCFLTWKNGHKTQHDTSVLHLRAPLKVGIRMPQTKLHIRDSHLAF
jgi:chromobox protein 1